MKDDPDWRIDELERRLDAYFRWLEESVEQRDRFGLNATWGILKAAAGISAYIAVSYVSSHWLGLDSWAGGIVSGVGGLIAYAVAATWIEKGEDGDLKKLYRLPKWPDIK